MNTTFVLAMTLLSGCSLISGISNSCIDNKADGSRICTMIDTNQNVTTRTVERDNKLFISTCSYGSCTDFKQVVANPDNPAATLK